LTANKAFFKTTVTSTNLSHLLQREQNPPQAEISTKFSPHLRSHIS
jgi:hypothetical protein